MIDDFVNNIRKLGIFKLEGKVILGVSGGVDSMVMAELFYRSGYRFAIAHCNFNLRGRESDGDELHVRKYSNEKKIPFFSTSFDTKAYSKKKKISVQMAARELRVAWFNLLLEEHGYDYYATAHHQDDQIETFFINLMRGTGISGIRGILPRQGKLIHPMLFTNRAEILDFAMQNQLAFREDSSNLKNDYLRNKIRHDLLPLIEKINPGFETIMVRNIEHFRSVEALYRIHLENILDQVVRHHREVMYVQIKTLLEMPEKTTILFEVIKSCGFNYADAVEMIRHLQSQPGKKFFSSTHRIIKDRDHLVIEPLKEKQQGSFLIYENDNEIDHPVSMGYRIFIKPSDFIISNEPTLALLDADLLRFPLLLRKWQKGDYFFPLGMKAKKLVSNYFVDQKFSITQKEETWLLTSAGKVVWIVGCRIDDRFKVTTGTTRIIEIRLNHPDYQVLFT